MLSLAQIRGAILEEIVLILLEYVGYRVLDQDDGEEIRNGHSGLELQGRGGWHQVDALASYDFTPSFIYPMRLIVEAKAYLPSRYNNHGKIRINVVRNAVGVLKDVNENYFSFGNFDDQYKLKRFNYAYAIFSLGGSTRIAQQYAIAHQIFIIQYYFNPLFDGIKKLLYKINENNKILRNVHKDIKLTDIRKSVRDYLKNDYFYNYYEYEISDYFTDAGYEIIEDLKKELEKIKGSYLGLLNGMYPIHLVSSKPLSKIREDEIYARIHVSENREREYVRLEFDGNELFFDLPLVIAEIFSKILDNRRKIAEAKREYINYITLTGKIDGITRNLIIRLDESWLENYLRSFK